MNQGIGKFLQLAGFHAGKYRWVIQILWVVIAIGAVGWVIYAQYAYNLQSLVFIGFLVLCAIVIILVLHGIKEQTKQINTAPFTYLILSSMCIVFVAVVISTGYAICKFVLKSDSSSLNAVEKFFSKTTNLKLTSHSLNSSESVTSKSFLSFIINNDQSKSIQSQILELPLVYAKDLKINFNQDIYIGNTKLLYFSDGKYSVGNFEDLERYHYLKSANEILAIYGLLIIHNPHSMIQKGETVKISHVNTLECSNINYGPIDSYVDYAFKDELCTIIHLESDFYSSLIIRHNSDIENIKIKDLDSVFKGLINISR